MTATTYIIFAAVTLILASVVAVMAWLNYRMKQHISDRQTAARQDVETDKIEEARRRYQQIFNTSLVAMSFYDPDGMLIEPNEKMRELCEFEKLGEKFFRNNCFFHLAGFESDFDPVNNDVFYVCQRMFYPEAGIDKYIEYKIRSIRDENGKLVFYAFTARDITPERNNYLQQHRHEQELRKTGQQIAKYEEELHYMLTGNNMYVWNSDINTRTIKFSTSLSVTDFTVTFDDYTNMMWPEEREAARQFINEYEAHDHTVYMMHRFMNTPISKEPRWYVISGMPVHDHNGRFTGHFGLMRDASHLMEVQEKLKQETQRAEDSGKKKSAFLANMTHEIRTPLNAIVGFSDLIQTVDTPDDRREFIRIIRNNCDMLLRLINDILEVSNINHTSQAVTPERVDFAKAFRDTCETLAQRVENPHVDFIADNPYDTLYTVIDKGRMQQVITNFVTNAVKYTEQGHIKIGYRYQKDPKTGQHDGIYMYCEDTGAGIPKDKQNSVFERFVKLNDFVQGTGLGLSICQSIAERCHGQIGVVSEGLGHGSTFWIWVPCEKMDSI